SDEELEAPMEDQPLPVDASPTALSSGYIFDFNSEEDEEDPADHPVNGGDNDDNESSEDDDDDDYVVNDTEAFETDECLFNTILHTISSCIISPSAKACITEFAAALPSSLPQPPENIKSLKDNIRETMTTVNQGMSVEEIKRVVAQRVANGIEAIAIYKTKTNMAHKSMSQTERQEDKVAENASNKRKWEGNHNGSSSQQNKGHKVPRAHTTRPISKKAYAGSLPLCNQCKFHHNGPCTIKCENCKKVGHIIQNCKTPATTRNQRTRTCYECGSLRHYKSECPIVKFQKRVDMIHGGVRASKPKTMQDAIEFVTKCPKCNYHHDGPCAPKCHRCNIVGHLVYRRPTNDNTTNNQRGTGTSQKVNCYECGNQGHYRRDCPEQKNQSHKNQIGGTGAHGVVHTLRGEETDQDPNNIKDEIKA
ncbi:reverse transcriptase domain-containing protein, partial [Tanacetum coccineum]